jgi:hypothetical protein
MATVTVDDQGNITDIEGEYAETPPTKVDTSTGELIRLAPPRQAHTMSGVGAVAALTDEAFAENLRWIKRGADRAMQMQAALLTEGVDFGTVPGIKRAFLHKPGAEKFEKAYGLATRFAIDRLTGDGISAPPFQMIAHAYVHLGDFDGPIIAEGIGEANSWETKYRYRNAERTCPKCGVAAIKRGTKRGTNEGEFYCWAKQGGCGARFEVNDPTITDQEGGKVDNPDPWDLANTLVKMATKRAHVDGILRATGTSGLFTQDDDSPSVRPDAPPSSASTPPATQSSGPNGETEELLGIESREGTAKAGTGATSSFDVRETPDGMAFGFLLETGKGSVSVIIQGDLAAAVLVAEANEPARLAGHWCRVKGRVYAVRQAQRRTTYRLRATEFETREYRLPAEVGDAPAAESPEIAAQLDALLP